MTSPIPPAHVPRATCYRCFRPRAQCYCDKLERIQNRTEIIILQHPRERFHPIGTARIAALCLERVRVEVDVAGRFRKGGEPLFLPPGTGLLYPEAPFTDLESLAPGDRPQHLVVIDGTWHHAHTLFRDVPGVNTLPRYGFTPKSPSEYRLRREPRAECVSTIEAVAQSLRALEPDTAGIEELVSVFRSMIDRQIEARSTARVGRGLKTQRAKAFRKLPRALTEQFERLVVVYGEWHCPGAGQPDRELIQWSAQRVATGETFDTLIAPSQPLQPYLLQCVGIDADAFGQAVSGEQFTRDWANFVKPDDLFTAWCPDTARRRTWSNSARLDSCISLKGAYRALARSNGPLEEIMQSEGLSAAPAPCLGRASQRMANAVALAHFIRDWSAQQDRNEQ